MIYHVSNSNMIKITKTQQQIMRVFLDNAEPKNGISSYTIGKNGIPRRTFEINRNKLLDNFLIEIVEERTTGKQKRIFYKITPLGFFCMLANMNLSELKEEIRKKNFCDFIPLIGNNWDGLKNITKNESVLLQSLNLSTIMIDVRKSRYEDGVTAGFGIITDIPFSGRLDVKFWQDFHKPFSNDEKEKIYTSADSVLFHEKILHSLYFSFFIALLGAYTTRELFSGIRIRLEENVEKQFVTSKELKKHVESWKFHQLYAEKIVNFFNNDDEIKAILREFLVEFNKSFKKPENIMMIEKIIET